MYNVRVRILGILAVLSHGKTGHLKCSSLGRVKLLRPVHTRDPTNPRSLPLWKNGRIGNERALVGKSVCWSKIQRGLVGPALRGRGERDKFFNRLKNGRG